MTNHFNLHISSSPKPHHKSESGAGSSPSNISPPLDARSHKHYQSYSHVDTPYPAIEHTDTTDSTSSNSSIGSFLDVRKHANHSMHDLTSRIPNPVTSTTHLIQDHVAEFRYGHVSRNAKKEATRNSQHSSHRWSIDAEKLRNMSIPETNENTEEWMEKDRLAWEAELKKREQARRSLDNPDENKR